MSDKKEGARKKQPPGGAIRQMEKQASKLAGVVPGEVGELWEETTNSMPIFDDVQATIIQGAIACRSCQQIIQDVEDAFKITLSPKQIKKRLRDGIKRNRTNQSIEDTRALEVARLDDLYSRLHETLYDYPDPKTVATMLRISERRAAMLGLDAPVQIEVKRQLDDEVRLFMNIMRTGLDAETFKTVMGAIRTYQSAAGLPSAEAEKEAVTVEASEAR